MRIHVVCKELNQDRVLPRLAKTLAEGTGWGLSEQPDHHADVNYFFPYLNYTKVRTKTAAWFTHHDISNPQKAKVWEDVAGAVDLRLTTASIYLEALRTFGRAEYVPPVVEDRFRKMDVPRKNEVVILGVSGYTYGDGRKGEDLIERLAQATFCKPWRWRGSGRGWPLVPTRRYAWQQMPGYYASLDVLVVPSRIEGIPMPPLEALATGTRVVIPRGVGMLDELPDIPGIYRFDPGNYDSLFAAIDAAVGDEQGIKQADLKAAVSDYTDEAWVEGHRVIEEHFMVRPPSRVTKDTLPDGCGVYYVAFGEPARKCAAKAIPSWKKHMEGVPVALVSNEPLGVEDIFIEQPDRDIGGRIAKLMVDELAPADWKYVLYLDADTEIVSDVSFLFQLLIDGWEFVICKDAQRYASTRHMMRPDNKDEVKVTWDLMGTEEAMQWNGGVFAFRRCQRTRAFFQRWIKEWHRWGKRDQAALLRAMHSDPLKMYILGNEWNTVTRYMSADKTAGILHYPMTARRWSGIVHDRLDSKEAFMRIVQ